MKYVTQVKSSLLTALVVLVAAQMVMAIITPLMPIIIGGLVIATIVGFLYYRSTRL